MSVVLIARMVEYTHFFVRQSDPLFSDNGQGSVAMLCCIMVTYILCFLAKLKVVQDAFFRHCGRSSSRSARRWRMAGFLCHSSRMTPTGRCRAKGDEHEPMEFDFTWSASPQDPQPAQSCFSGEDPASPAHMAVSIGRVWVTFKCRPSQKALRLNN